jgi:glycosyltransferase involved in cell wall biosynthesis
MKKNILMVSSYETGGGTVQRDILCKILSNHGYNIFRLSMGIDKNFQICNENGIKTYKIGKFKKNRRGTLNLLEISKYLTIEIFNPLIFIFTIYLILRHRIKTVIMITYNQISLAPLIASKILMRNTILTMHTQELLCSYSAAMPFCYGIRKGKCGDCMLLYHKLPKNFERLKNIIPFFYNFITDFIVFLKLQSSNYLVDKIVFPSDYSKRVHIRYGLKKEKAMVISYFLHDYELSLLENYELKKETVNEFIKNFEINGEKIILYLGRIEEVKGIEVLLKSLSDVLKINKKWKLLVVGNGRALQKIKNLTYELKIDKYVKFAGYVPHFDVYTYYHMSDIVVIPSIFPETFGLVLTEASLAKKIVIGSRIGALEQRIRDGENGFLVEPNNSKDLTEKIVFVLNNFKKLKNIGEKAYADVKLEHDFNKSLSQYLQIIDGD